MKGDIKEGKFVPKRSKVLEFQLAKIDIQIRNEERKQGPKKGFRQRFLEAYSQTKTIEGAKKLAKIDNRFDDNILKKWIEEDIER